MSERSTLFSVYVSLFDFLNQKPGEDITMLDKIVTVCCSLNNLCDSVVPTD